MSHVSPAKSSLEEAMRGELLPGSILRDSLQRTRFLSDTTDSKKPELRLTQMQHTHCQVKFSSLVMNLICYTLLQKGWQAASQLL